MEPPTRPPKTNARAPIDNVSSPIPQKAASAWFPRRWREWRTLCQPACYRVVPGYIARPLGRPLGHPDRNTSGRSCFLPFGRQRQGLFIDRVAARYGQLLAKQNVIGRLREHGAVYQRVDANLGGRA